MEKKICPICDCETRRFQSVLSDPIPYIHVKCPVCGNFIITEQYLKPEYNKDEIASFLFHHKKSETHNGFLSDCYLATENEYNLLMQGESELHVPRISIEEIRAFYPDKFSEKIDLILLALANKSTYFGKTIKLNSYELHGLLFIKRFDEDGKHLSKESVDIQVRKILSYLKEKNYIKEMDETLLKNITLEAEGWKEIEKLQKNHMHNKDVFVAMSFDEGLNDIRDAIAKGTTDAGFSAEFMDKIIHNQDIVPEMLRMIRECRFLIMDISEPNYGAYYEAGYALGLGKEVIITCSRETKNRIYETEEEKKIEKYKKPHFDIAQKQILVWDDTEDLSRKLTQWIKALFT